MPLSRGTDDLAQSPLIRYQYNAPTYEAEPVGTGTDGAGTTTPEITEAVVIGLDQLQRNDFAPPIEEELPRPTLEAITADRRKRSFSATERKNAPTSSGLKL